MENSDINSNPSILHESHRHLKLLSNLGSFNLGICFVVSFFGGDDDDDDPDWKIEVLNDCKIDMLYLYIALFDIELFEMSFFDLWFEGLIGCKIEVSYKRQDHKNE